jgi:hypothetical protein
MPKQDLASFFEKGFPLEKPDIILPWGLSLTKVVEMSGGVWSNDRYLWKNVTYLGGLDFILSSGNLINGFSSFKTIVAYVGLTAQGFSDKAALDGYKKTSEHLIRIFGEPDERSNNSEVPETETLVWHFEKIEMRLDVIEQHVYKCFLTISYRDFGILDLFKARFRYVISYCINKRYCVLVVLLFLPVWFIFKNGLVKLF